MGRSKKKLFWRAASVTGGGDVEVPCSPVRGAPQANTSAHPTALHSLRTYQMECAKIWGKIEIFSHMYNRLVHLEFNFCHYLFTLISFPHHRLTDFYESQSQWGSKTTLILIDFHCNLFKDKTKDVIQVWNGTRVVVMRRFKLCLSWSNFHIPGTMCKMAMKSIIYSSF